MTLHLVANSPRIGPEARARTDDERRTGRVGISAITPWEVALLVAKGRLRLAMDVGVRIDRVLGSPGIDLCPIEPAIALDSARLPGEFHADPADRFLIAAARIGPLRSLRLMPPSWNTLPQGMCQPWTRRDKRAERATR